MGSHYRVDKSHIRWPDPAQQWADYLTEGEYTKVYYELVPIGKIGYDRWSEDKYERALGHMESGDKLNPVTLSKVGSRYSLSDGNHRVAASETMGYTQVPALVYEAVKEKPPGKPPPGTQKKLVENEFYNFLMVLRRYLPQGVLAQWSSHSVKGYEAEIIVWNPWMEDDGYPLTVEIGKGNRRNAEFKRPGGRYRATFDVGRNEQFAKRFAKWMEGFIEDHPELSQRRTAMDRQRVAERLVALAEELTAGGENGTFTCPECGTKVLKNTGYCIKCKKKVEPKGGKKAGLRNMEVVEQDGKIAVLAEVLSDGSRTYSVGVGPAVELLCTSEKAAWKVFEVLTDGRLVMDVEV